MNFNVVTSLPSPSSPTVHSTPLVTTTIPGTIITTTTTPSSSISNANTIAPQTSILIDTSKIMEWTNDDALELIEQYRIHTELWNRADPKYKDKLCRFRAWSEIAERFGCSKAEVERKMNVLLTQYRREKHKMLVKLYEGIQPNPSKWYAFKRFDFMEVGGGSSGRNSTVNNVTNSNTDITNGHHHHSHSHHQSHHFNSQHHHLQQSHATLNGLSAFERTTTSVAAAAAAAVATTPTSSSLHRRMKSKEMKYFGAMGINLPMLMGNPNLDNWNSVGQFSPPIDRNPLRVPLPLPGFSSQQNELNVPNPASATRSIFGGSSNSDYTASPQKPMDTSDIEDKDDIKTGHNTTPSNHPHLVQNSIRNGTPLGGTLGINISSGSTLGGVNPGAASNGSLVGLPGSSGGGSLGGTGAIGAGGSGGGAGSNSTRNTESVEHDAGSSPIPNTNIHEAHKRDHPIVPTNPLANRDQDDLDIKQEMIDYFHAPNPPAPPDSHRSYSSTDENRLSGNEPEDYAQDLRVSAAAAAAAVAAKTLDFSQFVLPRNIRRSIDESIDEEKYTPLNMRKLSTNSANTTSAGHMLMNSLLSNENISESDNTTVSGGAGVGPGGNRLKPSSQDPSNSAAAAAAALYAESLNKDDCDFIGANVSLKLRSMDRTQRIIAEKLISEVLFYGQFNELERNARILPK